MKKRTFLKSISSLLLASSINPSILFANDESKVVLGNLKIDGKAVKGILPNLTNSIIETSDKQSVVKIKDDVFLLRPQTKIKFIINQITEVIQGSVHSAFGKKNNELKIKTSHGTIGIRGTVVYIENESQQNRTYVCNCFGDTVLYDNNNQLLKSLKSDYHNPAVITSDGKAAASPYDHPLNHYDDHIEFLEKTANREPRWKLPEGKKIFFSPNEAKIIIKKF
jgi:hypothetical protein